MVIYFTFRCILTNDFIKKPKKSNEANLTVTLRLKNKESALSPSLFSQTSYSYNLVKGERLSLACAASGYPSPIVTWIFFPNYTGNLFIELYLFEMKFFCLLFLFR